MLLTILHEPLIHKGLNELCEVVLTTELAKVCSTLQALGNGTTLLQLYATVVVRQQKINLKYLRMGS